MRSIPSRTAKMAAAGDPSISVDLLVRTLLRMRASRHDHVRHLGTGRSRRAIATRYDKTAEGFLGMLYPDAIKIWLEFVLSA